MVCNFIAAKHALYLPSIMRELGFPQHTPTPIYEDNISAINMINTKVRTDCSRHIDIQFFAIQDWKENGDILMQFIPGALNAAEDLTKPLGGSFMPDMLMVSWAITVVRKVNLHTGWC